MLALITGASSGIGEATARALAAVGYDLVLAARRKERMERLASELAPRRVKVLELDVRDQKRIESLVQENRSLFSGLDVLVNNAGLARGLDTIQDGKTEDWDETLDTNVKGLLYVTRALLPFLISRKGHIVNLGSVAGHWVYPKGAVYCASKHAVDAINQGLRFDLQGTGVRVSAISPGMVETEFSEVRFRGDKKRAEQVYSSLTPLTPQDIADAIVWTLSRPKHVDIQEIILYPTEQAGVISTQR